MPYTSQNAAQPSRARASTPSSPGDGARKRRRSPLWARLLLVMGVTLMVISGVGVVGVKGLVSAATSNVTQQNLLGAANTERKHVSVTGAKNILLVGLDRQGDQMRSDSIILLHIPAAHDRAYLISLPRDTLVHIPAYDNGKVPYRGGDNKINAAFAYGSRGLTDHEALSHGFELLSLTIKEVTGITPDAGAIIDFQGFKQVVQVLGKVCMYVDEDTTSIHIGHTADGKKAAPYEINTDGTVRRKVPGVTANFYPKGNHCFTPSEALDFVRQRDLLANKDFDYGRQRHQQQFIKAVVKQVMDQGLSSPTKLPGLMAAVGKTMTVDGGGISLEDWAFAMRGINPDDMVTIKTNNGKFNSRSVPGVGSAEILSDTSIQLLEDVKNDTVDNFVMAHPDWVAAS
ncbi:LCP family protein [Micromonospora sp. NPDC093277]|uniref:LCP family protein n=1 Tax=Micromonospora sp. NPDC093277 TaxID=3364291 RepID=UPI0037FDF800